MNEQPVVIAGVVKPDGTLDLESKVPLRPGRVTVTVQPLSNEQKARDFRNLLEGIWARQKAAGIVPPTREEVDAYIEELRDESNRIQPGGPYEIPHQQNDSATSEKPGAS
jgi:hypothetical protein